MRIDRANVWRALNDPEVLKASIPGCVAIEKINDNEFAATVSAALGPVHAKFLGRLWLENVVAPERYTLRFEAEGGAAGSMKGIADVSLAQTTDATVVGYKLTGAIDGVMAAGGSSAVDAVAPKLADEFFSAFEKVVSGTISAPSKSSAAPSPGYTRLQAVLVALILAALVTSVAYTLQ